MIERKNSGAYALNIVGLHAAAHHFAKLAKDTGANPTFAEVSKITGISTRTLQRYEERDEWTDALRSIGVKGDTKYRRGKRSLAADATPETMALARALYQNALADGVAEKAAYNVVVDATGFSYMRVKYLAKAGHLGGLDDGANTAETAA